MVIRFIHVTDNIGKVPIYLVIKLRGKKIENLIVNNDMLIW